MVTYYASIFMYTEWNTPTQVFIHACTDNPLWTAKDENINASHNRVNEFLKKSIHEKVAIVDCAK